LVGWFLFPRGSFNDWLLISSVFVSRSFLSPETPPPFFSSASVSHVYGDLLLTTKRVTICLITHILRQGHWSAVTIPNGWKIFSAYYHLINSAWKNLTTFVKSVSNRLMSLELLFSDTTKMKNQNLKHKTPGIFN
jgi:hypothetical protein